MHYYGPVDEIRQVKQRFGHAQVSVKAGIAHVFCHEHLDPLIELPHWQSCSDCELCDGRKARSPQPKIKFAAYPPLVLLPTAGPDLSAKEIDSLLTYTGCTHVARNAAIQTDRVRRPCIQPLRGDFRQFDCSPKPTKASMAAAFWCSCTQHGIYQTWAPLYTMFSRGNVTEKQRVMTDFSSQATIENTDVIDLYAGIGYFTLCYARQKAARIFCWEINWWSVEGLLRAAAHNGFQARAIGPDEAYVPQIDDQIVVFVEDNLHALARLSRHKRDLSVSHINMGLLPHCHAAFSVACGLAQNKTVMHVHENVPTKHLAAWEAETGSQLTAHSRTHKARWIHTEPIKEYAPGITHVCGDFIWEKYVIDEK